MNPCMIIVTGYLASGKSTFALRLLETLRVPYLIKDTFKIALSAGLSLLSREDKSRFSVVTFDAMMYVAERLMETGFLRKGRHKVCPYTVPKRKKEPYGVPNFLSFR